MTQVMAQVGNRSDMCHPYYGLVFMALTEQIFGHKIQSETLHSEIVCNMQIMHLGNKSEKFCCSAFKVHL